MPQYNEGEIREKVEATVRLLQERDAYLLEHSANDRSITHRLAIYLEEQFPDWNVDCEYNRKGGVTKLLYLDAQPIKSDDAQGTTVYPDIIVHRRGRNDAGSNLLVIEVKKSSSNVSDAHDREKLEKFKSELGYQYALPLKIGVGPQRSVTPALHFI